MRVFKTVGYILLTQALHIAASAQGTFENLDFESANIPSMPGLFVPISEALPGWDGYLINTSTSVATLQTQVVYDGISTGGAGISLIDDKAPPTEPIQGNYSVYLFGGPYQGSGPDSAEIAQTGLIPAGTESLVFDASMFNVSPIVAINGQAIAIVPWQTLPNYTEYRCNISSFAGQVGTLSFTDPPPASDAPSMFLLDNISFSPNAIPEPGSLALIGIGGALFAAYRRLMPKRH